MEEYKRANHDQKNRSQQKDRPMKRQTKRNPPKPNLLRKKKVLNQTNKA